MIHTSGFSLIGMMLPHPLRKLNRTLIVQLILLEFLLMGMVQKWTCGVLGH